MAQKEPESGPSLELPSLFGRRRRRAGETAAQPPRDEGAGATGDTTTIPRTDEGGDAVTADASAPLTAHTPALAPTPAPEPAPARSTPPAGERPSHGAVTSGATRATSGATKARATGGRRRAASASRSIPEVAASTAAFLTGAVVGLIGCVLTYLGLQGCEVVTGTDSCGGPGLLVLVVILVAMVLLGAAVLRALRVPDPGNVSFLGVGVLTVVALVFLVDYLYDPWMFLVVPAVTAVSFALARWISTLYAEDVLDDDHGTQRHDIR